MSTYQINGTQFNFEVLDNLTEPCPACHVPACGQESILWYNQLRIRKALIFDGGLFGSAMDEFTNNFCEVPRMAPLPLFLKEHHECNGWSDNEDNSGVPLDHEDFLAALDLMLRFKFSDTYHDDMKKCLLQMKKTTLQALSIGSELRIITL
jgi:hypothetical protein